MKMKPYCVGYPMGKIIEEETTANERLLKAIFGDMDQEEYEDYQAQRAERFRQKRETALKKAPQDCITSLVGPECFYFHKPFPQQQRICNYI